MNKFTDILLTFGCLDVLRCGMELKFNLIAFDIDYSMKKC